MLFGGVSGVGVDNGDLGRRGEVDRAQASSPLSQDPSKQTPATPGSWRGEGKLASKLRLPPWSLAGGLIQCDWRALVAVQVSKGDVLQEGCQMYLPGMQQMAQLALPPRPPPLPLLPGGREGSAQAQHLMSPTKGGCIPRAWLCVRRLALMGCWTEVTGPSRSQLPPLKSGDNDQGCLQV